MCKLLAARGCEKRFGKARSDNINPFGLERPSQYDREGTGGRAADRLAVNA